MNSAELIWNLPYKHICRKRLYAFDHMCVCTYEVGTALWGQWERHL